LSVIPQKEAKMVNRLKLMKARVQKQASQNKNKMVRQNERWDRRAHNKPVAEKTPKVDIRTLEEA